MGTRAAIRHGRVRQTSEPGPCWHCRRVLWVPGPCGQYSGEIRFIKKHGVQDEVSRHVAKRSSDPRQALFCKIRKVKTIPADVTTFYRETWGTRREGGGGGGGVAIWLNVILTLAAGSQEKFVLSSPRGEWAQETCTGC